MLKTGRAVRWFFAIVILAIVVMLIVYMTTSGKTSAKSFEPSTTQSRVFLYTVKEYQGKVAVFEKNNTSPKEVYDTYVESLPEADRNYLKAGIKIETDEELESLLEDLTS